jgi:serine/threonine-protein kinase
VHRDLAPQNVIVAREGQVKVGGWGFGEVVGRGDDTSPGSALGYLAPEQLTGNRVSVRTDVYAGALIVRELVTREQAFPRNSGVLPIEYLEGMARPSLPPVADVCPWVPTDIAYALTRALASDPEERSITAAQMRDLLTRSVEKEDGARALTDAVAGAMPVPLSGTPVKILA